MSLDAQDAGPSALPPDERHAGDAPWELAEVVKALRAVRQGASQRFGHARRVRPSQDALRRIVRSLRAVLFPTHFGISDFTDESIDFFVGHTLDTTLRELEGQVRRGLLYELGGEGEGDAAVARRAHHIVGRFAARLPAVREALELDIRAAYDGDPAAKSRAEILFCYPGITAITHHRIAHELYLLGVPILPRVVSEIAHSTTGVDIHPGARIGESFFIDHGTGVVIGETAVIGHRVRLYQGVTLGARNFPLDAEGAAVKGLPRHPIIEDDVVIYAGATILGRITIGQGSTIGGNVWLTRSVPANSQVTQAHTRHEVFDAGAGI